MKGEKNGRKYLGRNGRGCLLERYVRNYGIFPFLILTTNKVILFTLINSPNHLLI